LAYNWLHRFDNYGLNVLKDKERSGRSSDVSIQTRTKIRKDLTECYTGMGSRHAMDIIFKIRVSYHESHRYKLLRKEDLEQGNKQKVFFNTA